MRSHFCSLILFCLLTGALSSCTNKPNSDESEKVQSLDTMDSENKLQALNNMIANSPDDAKAYYERALIFIQKNILQQAFKDLSMATILDSTNPDYFLMLADVSFRGLQIQQSVKAFEKCLNLDPENIEANLKLSELYMYLKAYPKAIEYANEALRIDSRRSKAYFIKGFVYKESGDTNRAISSFTTVTELDPQNYDAYIQLGILYAAKDNDLALQYYTNALRVRPASEEALYNRGLYYQESGLLEKAEEDYKAIIAKNSNYVDAYYNLGFIALVNKKDYPEAIKQFSAALKADQNYVEAFYNRGLAYEYSGDKDAAIKDYRSALSIFPTYALAKERLSGLGSF